MSEMLEAETWRVTKWLITRAVKIAESVVAASSALTKASPVLLVLDHKDELQGSPWTIGKLAELENKEKKRDWEAFSESLIGRTLVVSSLLAGLNGDGMLDVKFDGEPSTINEDETWEPAPPFRVSETTEWVAVAEKGRSIRRYLLSLALIAATREVGANRQSWPASPRLFRTRKAFPICGASFGAELTTGGPTQGPGGSSHSRRDSGVRAPRAAATRGRDY
jgi:hypothetical protein